MDKPKRGRYYLYGYCLVHGWVEKSLVVRHDKNGVPYCPEKGCNRRLRSLPKSSHLREKYRGG